jgi:hypothetical protein
VKLTRHIFGDGAIDFNSQYTIDLIDGCADSVRLITTQVVPVISPFDQGLGDRSGFVLVSSALMYEPHSSLTWLNPYPPMAHVQYKSKEKRLRWRTHLWSRFRNRMSAGSWKFVRSYSPDD